MPNTNANVYPALGINAQNQVFGVDPNNNIHLLSEENFAQVIAISENGTIWAITTDPLTGGAQLAWSVGDGNWTIVISTAPGAVFLTGSVGGGALYYTEDQTLWGVSTNGESEQIAQMPEVQDIDYGGGYLWMVAPIGPDTQACLQFTPTTGLSYNWKPFAGIVEPNSIAVNYQGYCYGVQDFSPVYYAPDGSTTGSGGSGAEGSALEITFKNTYYLLSTNGNENGNDVLIWEDVNGGTFVNAGFQAVQVLGTYYSPNS